MRLLTHRSLGGLSILENSRFGGRCHGRELALGALLGRAGARRTHGTMPPHGLLAAALLLVGDVAEGGLALHGLALALQLLKLEKGVGVYARRGVSGADGAGDAVVVVLKGVGEEEVLVGQVGRGSLRLCGG